jgi:hypothetical protein
VNGELACRIDRVDDASEANKHVPIDTTTAWVTGANARQ